MAQRLEREADQVARLLAPVRPTVEQLGTGQGHDDERDVLRPLQELLDEVEEPRIGPLEVLEQHDRRGSLGDPLEEDAPGGEQDVAAAGRGRFESEEGEQGRLDPVAVVVGGDELGDGRLDPLAGDRLVVRLGEAGPPADHLAERPERDPSPYAGDRPRCQ